MANERRIGRIVGKFLIGLVWLVLTGLLVATGVELFLKARSGRASANSGVQKPRYERLREAYGPFTIQHINPHYLFFFPFDPTKRAEINNEVCSVNEEGFRGPRPQNAGNRKLAFLLGGSSAFGHYASSDSTTITGYLNQIQQEYFFVNAGVPSWNSTQELYRVAYQITEYKPALVIAYNGWNDLASMLDYWRKELVYPPGTPESFDHLYALVGDIRAGELRPPPTPPFYEKLFPRLTKRLRSRLTSDEKSELTAPAYVPDDLIANTARKYTNNLTQMHDLVTLRGGRFIGIFQPILLLQKDIPRQFKGTLEESAYQRFHDMVVEKYKPKLEYHDLSGLFDARGDEVLFFDNEGSNDITDKTIFVDRTHLYDYGNRIVAEQILCLLANSSDSRPLCHKQGTPLKTGPS